MHLSSEKPVSKFAFQVHNLHRYTAGLDIGWISNIKSSLLVVAPTEIPSDEWLSDEISTLASQYAPAERAVPGSEWAKVPSMRIAAVHGLDDDDPTMAAALRQLSAL